ncbi:hypothetical protein FKP32DRAFT_1606885 [Trametes sanguinea]|nr:hypothetical protein FKP32DRAFT_1606885 [Trametes sanguinea]
MLMTSSSSGPSSNETAESYALRNMHLRYMAQEWPSHHRSHMEASSPPVPGPSSLSRYSPSASSADPYGNDPRFENSPLIRPPSPSRLSPLAGLPAEPHQLSPHPNSALFPSRFTHQHQFSQDVLRFPVNASSSNDRPDHLSTSHGPHRPDSNLESFQLPRSYPTQHVALNATTSRPRTSHPVFTSTSDLAAHHGIPQSLPPVPRTTKFAPVSSAASAPQVASSSNDFDFSSLCSNYLTMLSQKPEETQNPATAAAQQPMSDTFQALMEVVQGGCEPAKASAPPVPHPPFNFDDMYTMPSPTTPSLDPTSLHPSPRSGTMPTPSTPGTRVRKTQPTGTRKNITPDALVPLDAPIQPRKYVVPSATSRKEVPTAFLKKKRARSQAFGEEDELAADEVQIDQNDLDAIEAKRRQNTLAARRSRKRKLEYQRELEMSVEREKEEKEMWKRRAAVLQALLESHGHEVPSFDAL